MNNLAELLYQNAGRFRKRIALKSGERRLTFQRLNQRTNQLARGLLGLFEEPENRVGILLNNSIEFILAYFAVVKTGATVVPLNNFLKATELEYIFQDSGLQILFTELVFKEIIGSLKVKFPKLKVIYLEPVKGELYWSDLYRGESDADLDCVIEQSDIASILYTSGTTGRPKGAMLSHGNLLANALSGSETIEVSKSDRFLLFLPMFHSFTFTVTVILPLLRGSRIVILTSVRPFKKVIKALIFDRITVFVAIPSVYAALGNAELPWYVLPLLCVRCYVSGGAALPVAVWEQFEKRFKAPLLEGYGLTEASPVVTFNSIARQRKGGSIGKPLPGVQVKIVDDNGAAVSVGTPGELLVKGPNVMRGYLNQREATAQAIRDGWLYTGDIATVDEDGFYYIVDRKKDLIIVRGINVYPREIEETLHRHPAVREAAVIGIPDELRGEIPKAFVVLFENEQVSRLELKKFCQEHLADYKIPHFYEIRASLPKNPTGKILKRQLVSEEKARLASHQ